MIFLLALILDQFSKCFILQNMTRIKFIPNFFEITFAKNTGGIFGMAQGNNTLFLSIAVIILLLILLYLKKTIKPYFIKYKLWQLILAGGIGNVIDRAFRGFVVDFIMLKPFGIFNFADIYITLGVGMLFIVEIYELLKGKDKT